jgi:hypothetical protein
LASHKPGAFVDASSDRLTKVFEPILEHPNLRGPAGAVGAFEHDQFAV